jgi:hypothetical protein
MKTQRIKLSELRQIVKQVIREESNVDRYSKYNKSQIKENEDKPVEKIKFNSNILYIFHIEEPFKDYIYAADKYGDPYIDVSTILPDNKLVNAVWVKMGGKEEKIADKLSFLEKTKAQTQSGYDNFIMYNIK